MALGELLAEFGYLLLIPTTTQDGMAQYNELFRHRPTQAARDTGDHDNFLFRFVIVHNENPAVRQCYLTPIPSGNFFFMR